MKNNKEKKAIQAVLTAEDEMREGKIIRGDLDDLATWMDASGQDILKEIGPISKKEYDYYEGL